MLREFKISLKIIFEQKKGAFVQFQTTELDQIIHFDFDESVFDLMVISVAKTAILFILISELEEFTTRIALYSSTVDDDSAGHHANGSLATTSTLAESRQVLVEAENDATEVGINSNQSDQSSTSQQQHPNASNIDFYKTIKKLLHLAVLLVALIAAVYVALKFAFVLSLMLKSRRDETAQPMTDFFFTILAVEFGFTVVELLVSTLTWVFMRRIGTFVASKLIYFLVFLYFLK